MLLVNTVPTKVGGAVQAGATRDALVARLGRPHHSDTQPISLGAARFPTTNIARIRDVYHVSGLMQMHGDPYWTDWNVYPAAVILSAGLVEVYMFPYVALDMTVRSFCTYKFVAWYDSSGGLVAFERRRRGDD